ncbi:MAG: amidase family protein [Immundisolibacter sp.]|uniref:amidase family protein n=1 Tax=Immundisolibacter sp. TaxID=1934948 RepID=UPI003EDE7D56
MWHTQSVTELGQTMANGGLSAAALTQYFLDRIGALNKAGPALNAVREVNPRASDIARALDDERRAGHVRGPLHGIPVLLKDNIATGDGMACTAGSLALAQLQPRQDAELVRRLRAAGAVILGKCNMTEFADYLADVMPSEFSSAGGVVRHPWGKRYDRGGGSSIGAACAVAAGLCVAAVGSETQNSIQTPASQSGVVGLKPTVGLISRSGMMPLAISQDTAGPITRSVADACVLLSALAGVDLNDTLTLAAVAHLHADYSRFLDPHALRGARIGVPRQVYFGREEQQDAEALVEQAIVTLRTAGAIIIDPADVPTAHEVARLHSSVFACEFKAGLNAFLAAQNEAAPVHSLGEIVAFNQAHPEQCLKYGQVLAENAERSGNLDDPTYRADRLRDITLTRELGIDAVCRTYGLDALVMPGGAAAKLSGKAGYPAITVPIGHTGDGSRVGMSFIGQAFSEPRLIALAYAFEQVRGGLSVALPDGL